jgi:hypothetical protein
MGLNRTNAMVVFYKGDKPLTTATASQELPRVIRHLAISKTGAVELAFEEDAKKDAKKVIWTAAIMSRTACIEADVLAKEFEECEDCFVVFVSSIAGSKVRFSKSTRLSSS